MAGQWKPIPDHTYLWNTAHLVVAGMPVVATSTAGQVDQPAGTSADVFVGVAQEDAGTGAPLGQDAIKPEIAVQEFGTARMYGKAGITAGQYVKINGSTISVTPPGYTAAVNVWPVTAASQVGAGVQPFPIVGRAQNATTADGDIVYVDVMPGAYF